MLRLQVIPNSGQLQLPNRALCIVLDPLVIVDRLLDMTWFVFLIHVSIWTLIVLLSSCSLAHHFPGCIPFGTMGAFDRQKLRSQRNNIGMRLPTSVSRTSKSRNNGSSWRSKSVS